MKETPQPQPEVKPKEIPKQLPDIQARKPDPPHILDIEDLTNVQCEELWPNDDYEDLTTYMEMYAND